MKSGKLGNEAVGLFLSAFILFIEGITTLPPVNEYPDFT